ncbi:hypothetical protein [Massilia sp. METH4]|uniref:hypothetical protein n=1 Tax=Massilia sp. METH4 TaxID=3123041 RepID=UPI0030D3AEA2
MRKFWIYGIAVVFISTVLSWTNMDDTSGRTGYRSGGSAWSSSTGGGSWGGGGGHK